MMLPLSPDILATTLSILSDSTLPIDLSRVAMGGFSAGAQLSLSVSASPELKGKIITCVNVYGVNNSSVDLATKMATRPKTDVPDVRPLLLLLLFSFGSWS